MKMISNCPVCREPTLNKLFSPTDYLVSKESFDLIKCSSCGFIFTADPPSAREIGKFYKWEDYISHSDINKGLFNRIYHLVRNRMLARKYKLVKNYTGNKRGSILDIGCGTGYFPGYMKNRGWSAYGVESDALASEYARSKFGLDILELDDIESMSSDKFDAVTLWHVLEHLHEPEKIFSMVERILRNKGILIIALPNNTSFDARRYGSLWAAWDVPRHLWHFNLASFSRFIAGTNFEIIAVRKMPLDAFYVSILSERNMGNKLAFLRGMLSGSIGWFSSVFHKSECSSLIYILKKKS